MPLLRLFIAIDTPDEIKSQIKGIISTLKSTQADVRWDRPEKLHITLKFLGDTEESLLPRIISSLEDIAARVSPFALTYSAAGCFPNTEDPRIIWIGVDDIDAALQPLTNEIDSSLSALGFERESRKFHAHLTIGRVKSRHNMKHLLRTMESVTLKSQPVIVSHIDLILSELKPAGSLYTTLKQIPLRHQKTIQNHYTNPL